MLGQSEVIPEKKTGSSVRKMMLSRQFVSLYVMAVFSFFLGSFTVANYKGYG